MHAYQPHAWQSFGLPMSTASDEACKMFDATLCQYVGWCEDDSVGGFEGSLEKMIAADENFVMGHVIKNGLDVLGTGTSSRFDKGLFDRMEHLKNMANKPTVTPWEKQHINAIYLWSKGNIAEACSVWESILGEKPKDILALKFAHDSYFFLGLRPQMRDSVARVLPYWDSSIPLYGYLHGMLAFGQEETNLFDQAEKSALKALGINKKDAWATHAMAHVNEMLGRQNQGSTFLETTEKDWSVCGMLACHNYWHWALYHIEKGQYEAALDIYDREVAVRAKNSGAMLDFVDKASLLYRLQLEGINVSERWSSCFEEFKDHATDHILSFNDAHSMMSCLGAGQEEFSDKLLESLQDFIEYGVGDNRSISEHVGYKLCKALKDYQEEEFAAVVDNLMPVRYDIYTIGGSNAQRDVFNLMLISAAMKSPSNEHKNLARSLINERKSLKENAPMTDRLMAKWLSLHGE
eukprot:XP_014769666.1 PREDICTED: tetratricopeptide repeat protein 38-like [Octopus bimaculoides]